MAKFIKFLKEAPVADVQHVGDFSKSSSFRKEADRRMVSRPKMVERIKKSFSNVDENLYLYFVNTPKANQHTELGEVSLDFVEKNLDEKLYKMVEKDFEKDPDGIFIIYTNNKGSEWKPMTPWMIAHRFGHALARASYRTGRMQQQFPGYEELSDYIKMATQTLLDDGEFSIKYNDTKRHIYSNNHRQVRNDELTFKGFWTAHATFKSARDGKIRDWFEVINEMIAQYMVTGKVKIKDTPQVFKVRNSKYHPSATGDQLKDFADAAGMYGRDIEYYIDNLISSASGRILVM